MASNRGSNRRSSRGSNRGSGRSTPDWSASWSDDTLSEDTADYSETESEEYHRIGHWMQVDYDRNRSARQMWNDNPQLQTKDHWRRLDGLTHNIANRAAERNTNFRYEWGALNRAAREREQRLTEQFRRDRENEERMRRHRTLFGNERMNLGSDSDSSSGLARRRSRSPAVQRERSYRSRHGMFDRQPQGTRFSSFLDGFRARPRTVYRPDLRRRPVVDSSDESDGW